MTRCAVACLALGILTGCILQQARPTSSPATPVCSFLNTPSANESGRNAAANIMELDSQLTHIDNARTMALVHLKLALLLSDRHNPAPDYLRATKEFDRYIAIAAQQGSPCLNVAARINDILKGVMGSKSCRGSQEQKLGKSNRKLRNSLTKTTARCDELQSNNDELTQELKKLRESVRKMQQLEMEIDRKRRSYK